MTRFARPYEGAETLDDPKGNEAIICRDPDLAAWLDQLLAEVGSLVAAVEDANEFRIVRAQIALVECWRQRP